MECNGLGVLDFGVVDVGEWGGIWNFGIEILSVYGIIARTNVCDEFLTNYL